MALPVFPDDADGPDVVRPLRVLLVDDESLARARMRTLLERQPHGVEVVGEAAHAGEALQWLEAHPGQAEVLLLDIQMPGPDGLRLAHHLRDQGQRLQIVFVTAHADHAVSAFDVQATDYLTKPVRLERLTQALDRCLRQRPVAAPDALSAPSHLVVQERGRVLKVALSQVLWLKAELKYVTLQTTEGSHVLDDPLTELEQRLGPAVLRIHRSMLVSRSALRTLERRDESDGSEGWAVQLAGSSEWLPVSRRQIQAVREALARPS